MKIAISSNGKDLESSLDLRFGRAFGFIIYDLKTNEYNFVDNVQNPETSHDNGMYTKMATNGWFLEENLHFEKQI